MTRFARAKGSKASNEKAPEDGTPWEVMKEQLLQAKKESEDAKNREQAEKQRIENYENFLKEHKVQKRKATWCDFPEDVTVKKQTTSVQNSEPSKKSKKKNKQNNNESKIDDLELVSDTTASADKVNKTKKKNKNKKMTELVTPLSDDKTISQENAPYVQKNKNNKVVPHVESESHEKEMKNSSQVSENVPNGKNNKKKNKKEKQFSRPDNSNSYQDDVNDKSFQTQNSNTFDGKQNHKNKKQKNNKNFVDGQPVRRKVVDDHSFQLIINGKEVELVRFDGFPIMKKDAERLQELKDSMIKKGIPKSEVQRTMKLERRRAEKALARIRREVCYNCRKGGHNLSDCPDLKSKIPGADAPDGVCFKCGSTEHRQFECKVQRDKEFRFATCFICKEPGHIARQCPDNPKGLYPNGGGCKLCGDVTHMRKDCPTANDKKEGTSIKLQTLDASDNIEGIGQQSQNTNPDGGTRKPKKIKF